MWKNREIYVDYGGVFDLSIMKQVTLQKIVAHDFRYVPRTFRLFSIRDAAKCMTAHIYIRVVSPT